MVSQGTVQTTVFADLLSRLGISRQRVPFNLGSEVLPVAVVDSLVDFVAHATAAYRVQDIFTNGVQTAPPVQTVLADTGPLPTGLYNIQVFVAAQEINSYTFEWMDVANAVPVWDQIIAAPDRETLIYQVRLVIVNADERFRIRNRVAGTVAIDYEATILARA